MSDLLHVHLPYRQLTSRLDDFLKQRYNAEIAFRGQDLDTLDSELLEQTAEGFRAAGLSLTVHAPFLDLNPGALEPYVFEATAIRYRQTLAAADRLGAKLVVFHPGYEYWKYGGKDQLWFDASLEFWPPIIELAEQFELQLAVENIYETVPDTLIQLLDREVQMAAQRQSLSLLQPYADALLRDVQQLERLAKVLPDFVNKTSD